MSRVTDRRPAGVAGVVHEIRAEVGRCRICPGMLPWKKAAPESFGTVATGYMAVVESMERSPLPFLREALAAVGDPRVREIEDLLFVAEAVRCAPRSGEKGRKGVAGKARPPTRAECLHCRPFLALEMRALRPRLVLAFGAVAVEAAAGVPLKLEEEHGRRRRAGEFDLMPLLLPSPRSPALRRRGITLDGYRVWMSGLLGALIDGL